MKDRSPYTKQPARNSADTATSNYKPSVPRESVAPKAPANAPDDVLHGGTSRHVPEGYKTGKSIHAGADGRGTHDAPSSSYDHQAGDNPAAQTPPQPSTAGAP